MDWDIDELYEFTFQLSRLQDYLVKMLVSSKEFTSIEEQTNITQVPEERTEEFQLFESDDGTFLGYYF